jgi:hypothetical protein
MESVPETYMGETTMTETNWPYNHRHTKELWDIAAEILTELSRRDEVVYQVKATPESVKSKLESL